MKHLMVLVLCLPAAMPVWADVDREEVIALSASVLKVEALRAQGGVSLGSGVVVAPEKVFTNCHVTRDAVKVDVLRGGVCWRAASQMSDVDHDLCLLRVPGLQGRVVTLGQADRLKPGCLCSAKHCADEDRGAELVEAEFSFSSFDAR
mgnify:CR=1 FL=1